MTQLKSKLLTKTLECRAPMSKLSLPAAFSIGQFFDTLISGLQTSQFRISQIRISILGFACLFTFLFSGTSRAQLDVVVTKRKNAEGTINRKGAIVEWLGLSLTLNSGGRETEIDNDDIVDVQTTWDAAYLAGVNELKAGRTQIAIAQFQTALTSEQRPWAQRIIRSKMIDAFLSIEKPADAVKQFLQITREDPQTRFAYLAPLPWSQSGIGIETQAQQWAQSNDPLTQLIGASWLTGGADKDAAVKILNDLASDIDPTVQSLATAQNWRMRVGVNEKQVEVWQEILDQMPRNMRAGPYYVLADAQARAGQVDRAMVNLMRIPVNYSEQRSLGAAALYRTAGLLKSKGDEQKSQLLLKELVAQHPQTVWANQARQ